MTKPTLMSLNNFSYILDLTLREVHCIKFCMKMIAVIKKTLWPESMSELYRASDRHLLAKLLVPTFGDRGCHVVSTMDPYGRILVFLDRSSSFSSM
jgi:hypothetical protein